MLLRAAGTILGRSWDHEKAISIRLPLSGEICDCLAREYECETRNERERMSEGDMEGGRVDSLFEVVETNRV